MTPSGNQIKGTLKVTIGRDPTRILDIVTTSFSKSTRTSTPPRGMSTVQLTTFHD